MHDRLSILMDDSKKSSIGKWGIVKRDKETQWGFSGASGVKNPSANARDTGDPGCIPGSGRSPDRGNGNPL